MLHMSVSAFLCFTIADSPECHHQAWLGEHQGCWKRTQLCYMYWCLPVSVSQAQTGYYSVSKAQTAQGTALFHRLRQLRVLPCFTGSDRSGYYSVSQAQTGQGTILFHRLRQLGVLLCFTGSDSSGYCCFTGSDSYGYHHQYYTRHGQGFNKAQTVQRIVSKLRQEDTKTAGSKLSCDIFDVHLSLSHRLGQLRASSPSLVRGPQRLLEDNLAVLYAVIFTCLCLMGSDSSKHHHQA